MGNKLKIPIKLEMLSKLEITEKELLAIIDIVNTMEGMIGCGDDNFDEEQLSNIKNIDALLKRHKYKRK